MNQIFKKQLLILGLVIFFLPSFSRAQKVDSSWYQPRKLMGHKVPEISGTTIQSKKVDSVFLKNKVIVLAFGNLVNIGSLQQIEWLNKIQEIFNDSSFSVLSIFPNAESDVKDFNSVTPNSTMGYQLRMTYNFPLMNYPVLATCSNRNPDNSLRTACDSIVKDFLIAGYPVLILVDEKRIVRYVHVGMPPRESQQEWYNVIDKQIRDLLK
ncbi:MAG: hypothetical protein LH473_08195 [Chitinophagales bacterium]|nr:hypothetical protein [Chitinophagales bacterium]